MIAEPARGFPPRGLLTEWFGLEGRSILVTGASRGLGAAMAMGLRAAGASLALWARGAKDLDALVRRLPDGPGSVVAVTADVTDEASVVAALDRSISQIGPLHGLVNNAGTNIRKPASSLTPTEFSSVIDTNLVGPFRVIHHALEHLARDSRVVNIGSVAGSVAIPTGPAYAAAKAGLHHLTRHLAQELAPRGITVNAIAPWYFPTPLTAGVLADPARARAILDETPIRRLGDPERDLVPLLVYLVGPAAGWITGQVIALDGGFTVSRLATLEPAGASPQISDFAKP